MDLEAQFNNLKYKGAQNQLLYQLSPINNALPSKILSDFDELQELLDMTDELQFDSAMLNSEPLKLKSLTPRVQKIPRHPSQKKSESKFPQQEHVASQEEDEGPPSQNAITFFDAEMSAFGDISVPNLNSNEMLSHFSFELESVKQPSRGSGIDMTANFGMAVGQSLVEAKQKSAKPRSKSVSTAPKPPKVSKMSKRGTKQKKKTKNSENPIKPEEKDIIVMKKTDVSRVFLNSELYIWEDIEEARKELRKDERSQTALVRERDKNNQRKRGLKDVWQRDVYMEVRIWNTNPTHQLFPGLPSRIRQPLVLRPLLGESYKVLGTEPPALSILILADGFHDGALIKLNKQNVKLEIKAHHKVESQAC